MTEIMCRIFSVSAHVVLLFNFHLHPMEDGLALEGRWRSSPILRIWVFACARASLRCCTGPTHPLFFSRVGAVISSTMDFHMSNPPKSHRDSHMNMPFSIQPRWWCWQY